MPQLSRSQSPSPSDDTLDLAREAKRPRIAWQGFEPLNGRRMDSSTDQPNRMLHNPQLPMGQVQMDTQRLLSVLKVIHTDLQTLTERVKALEGVCGEIKDEVSLEFDLEEDSEDSDEDESGSETESVASTHSAPASFQY